MAKLKFGDTSSCPAMHTSSGSLYKIGDRISDDSNNVIGTIGAFYTDSLDNEYAVCVLDAAYRTRNLTWMESSKLITNLPSYNNLHSGITSLNFESATTNTQLILNYCSSSGNSSPACTYCRSKSFTINGVTYYGQLPNLCELLQIYANHYYLGSLDTTESSANNNLKLSSWFSDSYCWSSNQKNDSNAWATGPSSFTSSYVKTENYYAICPVLEIQSN